jgi:hypothetical protein
MNVAKKTKVGYLDNTDVAQGVALPNVTLKERYKRMV